jgi:hypothetical protein
MAERRMTLKDLPTEFFNETVKLNTNLMVLAQQGHPLATFTYAKEIY